MCLPEVDMLDELEFRQWGAGEIGNLDEESDKGPWPATPNMMRMWRYMNSQLTEVYQYMHLIFGTATYAPAPPSNHVQHTATAIFHLLNMRQEQQVGKRLSHDSPTSSSSSSSSSSSESESELALADELLGGVTGHKGSSSSSSVASFDTSSSSPCTPAQIMEIREAEAWRQMKTLIQDCTELDMLLQVTEDEGPNVLLTSVIFDDQDILQLLIREGIDLNHPHCTLPLHLASRLGNITVVKMLLAGGASPSLEAGMCYPNYHVPIRHVPSRFHFLETDIYACDSDHKLPIMYAIEQDNVEIVRCLLEHGSTGRGGGGGSPQQINWPYHRYPLHYACSRGAEECVRYLVRVRAEQLNVMDEDGMTPLLHAVQWGHGLVKYLVESGSDVHARTHKNQSVLHLLYTNIQNPLELYATGKFLLGTGMEQDVNVVDAQGNSPLHCLTAQVNKLVPSEANKSSVDDQVFYDEQISETIDLLLSFNCDANIVNNSGVTALHKLLLSLDFMLSTDTNNITLETLPVRQQFKIDFQVTQRIMRVLLRHGANPNCLTSSSRGPLIIMLQMLLNMDPSQVTLFKSGYLSCLNVLLESGGRPSLNLHNHLNVVAITTKYGHRCLQIRDTTIQDNVSDVLKSVLTLLLEYGLNSNHSTQGRKTKYLECTSGNILLETVKLAAFIRQPSDLLRVHSWVLTLLQGGADPDVEPYPSDPIICHSQGSIFLKPKGTQAVNQYMYDIQDFSQIFDGGLAEMLLMLFFNTMDHDALYQCMNTAKFLSRFDPNRAPSGRFLQLIHQLSSQPRSLKQVARVAIYKAIDRRLSKRVPELPLPGALRTYLVDIE